jgi:HD-GYP domain-containing protein (c-di-GMP phosphodiesterase class II)
MAAGMNAEGVVAEGSENYFQVPSNLYREGQKIEEDLYLYYQGQYLLFRPKGFTWKPEDTQKLKGFGVQHLYINCASESDHHSFLEKNLTRIMDDEKVPSNQKSKILYESSSTILEGIYKNPDNPESVQRSVRMVESSIDYLSKKENFFELMKLATSDFSDYTHAIHVSAYAITLAKEMGLTTYDEMSAIGVGSILHDIGKVKIDKKLRQKKGNLSEDERKELEKHPMYGYEMVKKHKIVSELTEKVILMHHERPDGSGYPYKLSGDFLVLAKVVGICDCFDSLTTNRSFRSALSPLNALRMMQGDLADEYDQRILTSFIKMLAGK